MYFWFWQYSVCIINTNHLYKYPVMKTTICGILLQKYIFTGIKCNINKCCLLCHVRWIFFLKKKVGVEVSGGGGGVSCEIINAPLCTG